MSHLQPTDSTAVYKLEILKRVGDQVLEWVIADPQGNTVAQGDAMGYERALELVRRANIGSRTMVVGRKALL